MFDRVYVDSGVRNNGVRGSQEACICVYGEGQSGPVLTEIIGDFTSNEAEIVAISRGFEWVNRPGTILSDSQIAVNMMTGHWRGKAANLKKLVAENPVPDGITIEAGIHLESNYGI